MLVSLSHGFARGPHNLILLGLVGLAFYGCVAALRAVVMLWCCWSSNSESSRHCGAAMSGRCKTDAKPAAAQQFCKTGVALALLLENTARSRCCNRLRLLAGLPSAAAAAGKSYVSMPFDPQKTHHVPASRSCAFNAYSRPTVPGTSPMPRLPPTPAPWAVNKRLLVRTSAMHTT